MKNEEKVKVIIKENGFFESIIIAMGLAILMLIILITVGLIITNTLIGLEKLDTYLLVVLSLTIFFIFIDFIFQYFVDGLERVEPFFYWSYFAALSAGLFCLGLLADDNTTTMGEIITAQRANVSSNATDLYSKFPVILPGLLKFICSITVIASIGQVIRNLPSVVKSLQKSD